jgi:hypothetical protein
VIAHLCNVGIQGSASLALLRGVQCTTSCMYKNVAHGSGVVSGLIIVTDKKSIGIASSKTRYINLISSITVNVGI